MPASTERSERDAQEQRSIEELLGPSEERYFATGYRTVRYSLGSLHTAPSGATEAVGSITYPVHWSTGRDGTPAAPHLSSVDAVALSLQLAEDIAPAEDLQALSHLRVGAIELRAGTRPWLNIGAVPMTLAVETRGTSRHLVAHVGNMRVRIELVRASSIPSPARHQLPTTKETVYGGLFQSTRGRSLVEHLDTELGVLHGSHSINVAIMRSPVGGVEASQWASPTVIDYLVTMGQLTQALVYASAETTRSEAGPLWMRTMKIRIHEQQRSFPARFATTTRILHDRVLERRDRRIHDVLVESSATSGVSARSTLAYEEPSA